MFWVFLLLLAAAAALVKLGAMSVWVGLLSAALKLAAFLAIVLVAVAVWRLVIRS